MHVFMCMCVCRSVSQQPNIPRLVVCIILDDFRLRLPDGACCALSQPESGHFCIQIN